MGNAQSTRWKNHSRKIAVEECAVLTIEQWKQGLSAAERRDYDEDMLRLFYEGKCPMIPEVPFRVGADTFYLDIEPIQGNAHIKIYYSFRCPRCSRRSRKLYRPTAKRDYACRECHNLTYNSCLKIEKPIERNYWTAFRWQMASDL